MNDIFIDGNRMGMPKIMWLMGFVEEIGSYTRAFTRIYVEDNRLYIGHTINKHRTAIEFEDMKEWIRYFDRL